MGKKVRTQVMDWTVFEEELLTSNEITPEGCLTFLENKMQILKRRYSLDKYAIIKHDSDKSSKEGQDKVNTHYHVVMIFEARTYIDSVAERLGTESNEIEGKTKQGGSVQRSANNSLMYLIHDTDKSRKKFHYDPHDVVANFDYVQFVKEQRRKHACLETEKNKKSFQKKMIDEVFQKLAKLQIREEEAAKQIMDLDPLLYARYETKLKKVYEGALKVEHLKWIEQMKKGDQTIKNYWFCGEAGTGKTRLAIELCEKILKQLYFISGSEKDAMQRYQGEHIIIWDEMRASIQYTELLKMLDPFMYEKPISSRYYDKFLMPNIIFITTPFTPLELYHNLQTINRKIDKFDQLARRVPDYYKFENNRILHYTFNSETKKYYVLNTIPSITKLIEIINHEGFTDISSILNNDN
ncbi:Rep family protein [Limosilactobacillus caecicola]|uniref:Rep family protein n=1 Tax=Limosilactobacillus caecicola TaxID=2941332 RepID=UPI0020410F95|nr:Rep family protein [Limosilactobacillus caecicola]